jgi:hypothetical protein
VPTSLFGLGVSRHRRPDDAVADLKDAADDVHTTAASIRRPAQGAANSPVATSPE